MKLDYQQKLEHALSLVRSGDHLGGMQKLDELVALDKHGEGGGISQTALAHRAFLKKTLGKYEGAIADYRQFLAHNQGDGDVHALIAECLSSLGDIDGAFKEIATAANLCPRSKTVLATMTNLHTKIGGIDQDGGLKTDGEPIPAGPYNPVLKQLEEDPESSFPTSVLPEVGRMIYALVRATRPKLILETGSYIGYSSICITQALEDIGFGHLHCMDLFGKMPQDEAGKRAYSSPVLGAQDSYLDIAQGHLQKANLTHRATLHPGDSSATINKLRDQGIRFNMAFIDGDHTIPGCLLDWYAVDAVLEEGGLVLLHDINAAACKWLGPRFLLDRLSEANPGNYQMIEIPTYEGIGLAIVQKLSKTPSPRMIPTLTDILKDYIFTRQHWTYWTGIRRALKVRK